MSEFKSLFDFTLISIDSIENFLNFIYSIQNKTFSHLKYKSMEQLVAYVQQEKDINTKSLEYTLEKFRETIELHQENRKKQLITLYQLNNLYMNSINQKKSKKELIKNQTDPLLNLSTPLINKEINNASADILLSSDISYLIPDLSNKHSLDKLRTQDKNSHYSKYYSNPSTQNAHIIKYSYYGREYESSYKKYCTLQSSSLTYNYYSRS